MATKWYIPDRDFDAFQKGERVELDEDHPAVRTGYLQVAEDQDGAQAAEGTEETDGGAVEGDGGATTPSGARGRKKS